MQLTDTAKRILHAIAARADHAGHVVLDPAEVAFALSPEGAQWLEQIDAGKRLYKLTPEAGQQFAL